MRLYFCTFAEDRRIWNNSLTNCLSISIAGPRPSRLGEIIPDHRSQHRLEDYADCIHLMLTKEDIPQCCMIGIVWALHKPRFCRKIPPNAYRPWAFHSSAYADDDAKKDTRRKAISFINEKGADSFLKRVSRVCLPTMKNSMARLKTW